MHIIHVSYMSYICRFLQGLYLMSRWFVTRRSSKTANHSYPTRRNQRRQMEQIQEQMAEMRAQLTEEMNAQMAQFMEALANVTKRQDDLRVLVENSRRVENGGHTRLFDDVSGRIDDHIRMSLIVWEGTIILSI